MIFIEHATKREEKRAYIYEIEMEKERMHVHCNLCGGGMYYGYCTDCWENMGAFWLTFEELEERGYDVAAFLEGLSLVVCPGSGTRFSPAKKFRHKKTVSLDTIPVWSK